MHIKFQETSDTSDIQSSEWRLHGDAKNIEFKRPVDVTDVPFPLCQMKITEYLF